MFDKYKEKIEKSLEEFKSLLNEEFKVISTDTSTGYSIEIASKGAKDLPDMIKGTSIVKEPIDKFIETLWCSTLEERVKWDPQANTLKFVTELEKDYDILLVEYNTPSMMVSCRDFVFCRHKRTEKDGCTYLTSISLDEPNDIPSRKGVVRAALLVCAWRFKPLENGHHEVIYINHCNFNGWIPNWVINTSIQDQPLCIGRICSLIK